jgi:hypothetical protein
MTSRASPSIPTKRHGAGQNLFAALLRQVDRIDNHRSR